MTLDELELHLRLRNAMFTKQKHEAEDERDKLKRESGYPSYT